MPIAGHGRHVRDLKGFRRSGEKLPNALEPARAARADYLVECFGFRFDEVVGVGGRPVFRDADSGLTARHHLNDGDFGAVCQKVVHRLDKYFPVCEHFVD